MGIALCCVFLVKFALCIVRLYIVSTKVEPVVCNAQFKFIAEFHCAVLNCYGLHVDALVLIAVGRNDIVLVGGGDEFDICAAFGLPWVRHPHPYHLTCRNLVGFNGD